MKNSVSRKKNKEVEQETPVTTFSEVRTEAEKRFEEKKRQRDQDKLKQEAQWSYRAKVEVRSCFMRVS